MQFFDETEGTLQLSERASLRAHMSRTELLAARKALSEGAGAVPTLSEPIIPFPVFSVPGGKLACVCLMHGDRLHAVDFSVVGVGLKRRGTADQQRALLFQCLRAADPSKDSKRGVMLRCHFGTALVATDPRSGDATLRITYR